MQTWSWVENDKITRARNSQYLVPNSGNDNQNVIPCYKYNKENVHTTLTIVAWILHSPMYVLSASP